LSFIERFHNSLHKKDPKLVMQKIFLEIKKGDIGMTDERSVLSTT